MLRSVLSSAAVLFLAGSLGLAGESSLRQENGRWILTVTGTEPLAAGARVRVVGQGAVTLIEDAGGSRQGLSYSVQLPAPTRARDEASAKRLFAGFGVRVIERDGWTTLTLPNGPVMATIKVWLPHGVREAAVVSSDGEVWAQGLSCKLNASTGGGRITVDRINGECHVTTGGGDIQIGSAGRLVYAATAGGNITVGRVQGEAVLETGGGNITADEILGPARASTAGGVIRIRNAGGSVSATTGGGVVIVDRAGGVVTVRNAGGGVQVGAAAGVRCETATGAIRLTNISGSLRASTSMGNILASLMSGPIAESFLSTGNGDITVLIPSNLGVTIRAQNDMADTIKRIISEFPEIPVRLEGTQVVAAGAINGGGPMIRISGTGGTIFIKRQQ